MSDVVNVSCAKCKVPLQGTSESDPNGIWTCPSCGESDTLENVMREVGEQVQQQSSDYLDAPFRDLARRSKHFKFTPAPRQQRAWRFVIDLGLGGSTARS